ncbi:hypothetical protein PK28_02025 [Hymenobacter sp. DG25B]|nr:hypothetical protein PK28_02025 [Hymenobacter sp. DG25B]
MYPLFVCIGLLGSCATLHGQQPAASKPAPNRFDTKGERKGKWQEYFDAHNTQLASQGRYRHGHPIGRWRYYGPQTGLERVERYHWLQPGVLTLTYYHPSGTIAKQGRARIASEPDGIHFYWYGIWRIYNPAGEPIQEEEYVVGKLFSRKAIKKVRK